MRFRRHDSGVQWQWQPEQSSKARRQVRLDTRVMPEKNARFHPTHVSPTANPDEPVFFILSLESLL